MRFPEEDTVLFSLVKCLVLKTDEYNCPSSGYLNHSVAQHYIQSLQAQWIMMIPPFALPCFQEIGKSTTVCKSIFAHSTGTV